MTFKMITGDHDILKTIHVAHVVNGPYYFFGTTDGRLVIETYDRIVIAVLHPNDLVGMVKIANSWPELMPHIPVAFDKLNTLSATS